MNTMRPTARALGTLFIGLLTLFSWAGGGVPATHAQSLNFASGDSDDPIEVTATNGIEWEQENQVFTARGEARAVRGEVQVHADILRAYYRKKADGGTDIWRLDAEGNVRIVTPGETAYGDHGIYQVDNAILVLSGRKVRLVTADDEITADQQLEYWEKRRMAVARGNAQAVRGDKRLRADVLTAHFRRNDDGKTRVHTVEAFDNVRIDTDQDTVASDRAVYNVESGIVTLAGSVKITRGDNQLNGCSAEVNLNTNISKIKGCGAPQGGSRVHGLLQPGGARKKLRKKE